MWAVVTWLGWIPRKMETRRDVVADGDLLSI